MLLKKFKKLKITRKTMHVHSARGCGERNISFTHAHREDHNKLNTHFTVLYISIVFFIFSRRVDEKFSFLFTRV